METIVSKMIAKLQKLFADNYFKAAFVLFLVGSFLRFYKLSSFVTFLGDQGRDAIILRRILTFEHFPAIGAPSSIGQVYLGPFYYYFIAPWLLLFRFDPIGPAVGVAVFSSIFILLIYVITKELFDVKTALIATFLVTFSKPLVDLSRFSWNPNLMPLFALLTTYFLQKSLKKGGVLLPLLTGAFLSFSIQLHYLALLLLIPVGLVFILRIYENTADALPLLKKALLVLTSFVFFSLPLLIFDLRHDFLNTKNFIKLARSGSIEGGGFWPGLGETISFLNAYALNLPSIHNFISLGLFVLFVAILVTGFRKKTSGWIMALFLVMLTVGMSFFAGPKFPHYYGVVYPFYYIVTAAALASLSRRLISGMLVAIALVAFVVVHATGYHFLFRGSSNQINKAQRVAAVIGEHVSVKAYQVTGFPDQYSDGQYRYFLELWGKRPLEKDSLDRAGELFVICEQECQPIGNPQWDIAYFAPRETVGTWRVDDVRVLKLVK